MNVKKRLMAILLACVMVLDILTPTVLLALTSGPTQPEMQGFTPATSSDMVDLFSGDFSYNIPLLDVEGYPVNLFYQGGVTMDQEASWVGLGWNINPGMVNRNLRGQPDDFAGDQIQRTMNLRSNRTFGMNVGVGAELFGSELVQGSVGLSPSINNQRGVSMGISLGMDLSLKSTECGKSSFTAGLGLTSSSNDGLRLQPSIGIDTQGAKDDTKTKGSLNFGLSIDSRKGLTDVTLGVSAKSQKNGSKIVKMKGVESIVPDKGSSALGVSGSFDLGTPTYTPQLNMSMSNLSLSFNFTVGADATGVHPNGRSGAFFSVQKLRSAVSNAPAYGYLYLHRGQNVQTAMLDFNREKGGAYTPDQAALGLAALTPDIFSVSGQTIAGSYRPFRSEIGHVFDPAIHSGGVGGSYGAELGVGLLFHAGANISVNDASSWSGRWNLMNRLLGVTKFASNNDSKGTENVFFREANEPVVEADSSLYTAFGGDEPLRFDIVPSGSYDAAILPRLQRSIGGVVASGTTGIARRGAREPRAQLFSFLTHREVLQGFGLDQPFHHEFAIPDHHMSEVAVLDKQGQRYCYGLPAYNMIQEDVTFSVNTSLAKAASDDDLIAYGGTDNSPGNTRGIDHYYSKQVTPAYAHSFLLTAVLSADYSDIDAIKGPSSGDLGTYTRFGYAKQEARMPWRTPVGANQVKYDRGLGATIEDDKGSYTYGVREMYYLATIETANRIAVFELNDAQEDPRLDALGVGPDGQVLENARSRCLKTISLYDRKAYEAHLQDPSDPETPMPDPIKRVHFEYTYRSCPNTPNSVAESREYYQLPRISKGKLTLSKIWFSFGSSNRGRLEPYQFGYTEFVGSNPEYDLGAQDRWGNFSPNASSEFPYADQNEATANENAKGWSLWGIRLPSGAVVLMDYEADDYGYVQNRAATRMFKVDDITDGQLQGTISDEGSENVLIRAANRFYFPIPADQADLVTDDESVAARFLPGVDLLYFRSQVKFDWTSGYDDGWDYVSGYAPIESSGLLVVGERKYGWIQLRRTPIDQGCSNCPDVGPLFRASLEHARLNYPAQLYAPPGVSDEMNAGSITLDFLESSIAAISGLITGLGDFFIGPNQGLVDAISPELNSFRFKSGKTYIRLVEPDGRKVGGGHRVKRISSGNQWLTGVGAAMTTLEYSYRDKDGRSTGVAAYEPMIGADENPFRRPVYSSVERLLSADERMYLEEPFGESMFPAARVGYSAVSIREFPTEATRSGTGRVVHEFYTAKDFPTLTNRTGIDQIQRRTPGLAGIFGITTYDHMHTSQGFVVETNDMHGKPRSVKVYPEPLGDDQPDPIASTEYIYRTTSGGGRLANSARVILPNGTVTTATIGRNYEFLADVREFGSIATSGGVMANLETIVVFGVPIAIPPLLPTYSRESTRYRSVVFVKKIERSGLLDRVVQMDHGSIVSTQNLAYDARTGRVLLTRYNNEFNDPLFALEVPAYWHHDEMGPAYQNIGLEAPMVFANGSTQIGPDRPYVRGDELALTSTSGTGFKRAWVVRVADGILTAIYQDGSPIIGSWRTKIIRSGRRNLQDVAMAHLVSQADPLESLRGIVFPRVLKANAVEFKDEWRTDCACATIAPGTEGNPYRDNRRGVWRLHKERAWLSARTRSTVNQNSNIRTDGTYAAFSPFYRVSGDRWTADPRGWTVVREVTDYSSRSQELEQLDALGLFASATFTHGGRLTNSIAQNARYAETGFESFEAGADCADQHFRFNHGDVRITDVNAHTGRHSLLVRQGQEAQLKAQLQYCAPTECSFTLAAGSLVGTAIDVTVEGSNGPFTFDVPLILQGAVQTTLTMTGIKVTPPNSGPWSIQISVTDGQGCNRTLTLPEP